VAFTELRGRRRRLEVFFAPCQRGKGVMPTASTYGYHFRKASVSAGLVDVDGKAEYTPGSMRHFFASTALANGVPIREVSRRLGHKSIKATWTSMATLSPRRGTVVETSCRTPFARRSRTRRSLFPRLDVLDVLDQSRRCWIGAGYDHPKERFRRWERCIEHSASTCSS
jgi:hypothetical protein